MIASYGNAHVNTGRLWTRISLVHGLVITSLLTVVLAFSQSYSVVDASSLVYPACLSLTLFFVWLLGSWKKLFGLFNPYGLFLIAAILFNGGQAILEVFFANRDGMLQGAFSAETILRTIVMVHLSLALFHLGGLLSVLRLKGTQERPVRPRSAAPPAHLRCIGYAFLAAAIVPALVVLREAVTTVMASGYMGLYQRQLATGVDATPQVLAGFIVPGALFLLAGSKARRWDLILSAGVLLIYSGSLFFLGYRLHASMPIVAYAWVWHRCVRPLPALLMLLAGSVALFVLFPLITTFRNMNGADRLSLGTILEGFQTLNNPAVAVISEMGNSMGTIAHTLELVPRTRGFDMGSGYFYALLAVVPNLFWDVHPTFAHGTATQWLIWNVDPGVAARGGSIGYSFIAEAYLNFGWVGGPLMIGVVGFLYAKLALWADRSEDGAKIAMAATFVAFSFLYARGEANAVFRSLIWYAFVPYLAVNFLRVRSSSRLVQPGGRRPSSETFSGQLGRGQVSGALAIQD